MKKFINIYSVAAILLVCMWIAYSLKNRDVTGLCQLDSMVLVMQPVCFGKLVIPAVWTYMYSTRNDYAVARIIRMKNKKTIWCGECRNIIFYTAWSTALLITASWICGGVFFTNGSVINETWIGTNTVIVVIKASALCFAQLLGCMLFAALVRWLFDTYFPALMVITAVAISDGNFLNIPIYFSRFRYNMSMWLTDNSGAALVITKLILIIIIITFTGCFYTSRKEFIGADNNS